MSAEEETRRPAPAEAPSAPHAPQPDPEAGAPSVVAAQEAGRGGLAGTVPDGGSLADSARMVITVTLVAAISAGLLGFVNSMTLEPIKVSEEAEKKRALGYILPEYDNQPTAAEAWCCLEWPEGFSGPTSFASRDACQRQLFRATKNGETVGWAMQLFTTGGFGPRIDLLVGARPDGTVTGVYILNHQETPGLGAKAADGQDSWAAWRDECARIEGGCRGNAPFLRQFANRRPGDFQFAVKKDQGEVDAITASTITSRAVADSVAEAVTAIQGYPTGGPEACRATAAEASGAGPSGAGVEGEKP